MEYKLKKDKLYHTDIAAVGDTVHFDLMDDKSGAIHKIEKRINYISRKAPRIKGAGYRGERLEQIIASNLDNVCIVSSVAEPVFNNKVIDRLLVCAESSNMDPLIVINKIDLGENEYISHSINVYKSIGYNVFKTSAVTASGLNKLKNFLKGKKNIFIGKSGVGKSSLLNKMYAQINLQTGEISRKTDRGIHTTVTSIMVNVEENTYVTDTPGIREIDPFGIKKEDLGHYFIEFKEYIPSCRFNTCTHHHEPGCAVIDAVGKNIISTERYGSYLRLLETIEEDIIF